MNKEITTKTLGRIIALCVISLFAMNILPVLLDGIIPFERTVVYHVRRDVIYGVIGLVGYMGVVVYFLRGATGAKSLVFAVLVFGPGAWRIFVLSTAPGFSMDEFALSSIWKDWSAYWSDPTIRSTFFPGIVAFGLISVIVVVVSRRYSTYFQAAEKDQKET